MTIIRFGIAGRMRTGKTTVAQYLKDKHGFHTTAFADPIKEMARLCGWDGAKDERGRTLLQDMGTIVRKYNPTFWIEKMLKDLPPGRPVAVDDMRLIREHEALEAAGGWRTILIRRDGGLIPDAPAGTTGHVTETEVDRITPWRTIENNGTFEELYARVEEILAEAQAGR